MEGGNTASGGGFRPDAWWVVLLGVLSSVVTVLAYLGLKPPEPPAPSPSPGPTTTRSVPASSASSSPPLTLAGPTPAPGLPPVPPWDFNNVRTDPTQVSVATMLPKQYNDSGITFDRTSGLVHPCPAGQESAALSQTLSQYGCTSEVIGTYLDSSLQIQVTVWVLPLPDSTDAEGAFNSGTQSAANDWGIWCPATGVGSQICQEQWRSATSDGRIGYCHRYVMHAYALYVDLRSDSAVLPVLTSAATAANRSIGAQDIPGAQC